jgi:hypothetical protein
VYLWLAFNRKAVTKRLHASENGRRPPLATPHLPIHPHPNAQVPGVLGAPKALPGVKQRCHVAHPRARSCSVQMAAPPDPSLPSPMQAPGVSNRCCLGGQDAGRAAALHRCLHALATPQPRARDVIVPPAVFSHLRHDKLLLCQVVILKRVRATQTCNLLASNDLNSAVALQNVAAIWPATTLGLSPRAIFMVP